MSELSLDDPLVVQLGPVPVTGSLLTSLGLSVVLTAGSWLVTRRLEPVPGRRQAALELLVSAIDEQVRQVTGRDPRPYVPLLGTLFLFIAAANLSLVVPGVRPPTEHLETPMALALVVFGSVHVAGLRAQGLLGYLKHYLSPNPLFAPLHIMSEVTRTFSLTMRLFGNMMSHGLVLAVVATLAGLLVPIPLIALGLLVGVIQAYIFTVLAANYIAAAVHTHDPERSPAP